MPYIKPRLKTERKVRVTVRLSVSTRDALREYAEMIAESTDFVLDRVIRQALVPDPDFIKWQRARAATAASPSQPPPMPPIDDRGDR